MAALRWTEADVQAYLAKNRLQAAYDALLPVKAISETEATPKHATGQSERFAGDMPAILQHTSPRPSSWPYRSKLEYQYAAWLEQEQREGTINVWWYEPIKLRLATKCFYTPDFLVQLPSNDMEFRETKGGFIRDDSIVKIKVAARLYRCFRFKMVQFNKGEWIEKEISC